MCLCARQARGESDGGGPHGEACSELAAELAALGARLLGLLEEQVVYLPYISRTSPLYLGLLEEQVA